MPTRPENHQPAPPLKEVDAKSSPATAPWERQPSLLQGARFKGPIAKITTVDSPIRPPKIA